MARVVTLATRKGGAGKTTIAASLAVAAAQDGEGVVVIDLDPQGSLQAWYRRRETEARDVRVLYRSVNGEGLEQLLDRIHGHAPTTLAIIDTPGVADANARLGMAASNLTLLPTRPTILDIDAVISTAQELKAAQVPSAFVFSQVQTASAYRLDELLAELVTEAPIFPGWIGARIDHQDAMLAGQGVTEYRPRGQAADEVRTLWAWVKRELGERE